MAPTSAAIHALAAAAVAPVVVTDAPSAGAALPYVVTTGPMQAPDHYVSGNRSDLFFYLSVFSSYRGRAEVAGLLDQLHAALHDARPAVSGGAVALRCAVERQDIARDADELTFTGSMTVRVTVEH